MCQAGGWKSGLETLGSVFGKLGGQEMESFQGWGEVGGIIPVGIGTGNCNWSLVCSPEEDGLV